MIDLGQAGQQKEGVRGTIPPKSIVKARMEIRQPKKPDPQDPAVTIFSSGLKGLDCEFLVVGGQFDGVRIWENWFLPPSMQTVKLSKGQEGVCNGSFAKARAVIEAARNLDPADPAANRSIQSWFDLNGLEFPIKVGVNIPKPGELYLNNNIAKVLTMADDHYADVKAGGEVITDNPLPELPPAPASAGSTAGGPGGWTGGAVTQQPSAPSTGEQPPLPTNVPAWAK